MTAEPTPVRSFRDFDKRNSPGLPQSTALALLQDEKGLLWIATFDGLAYFDGTAIRPVQDTPNAPIYGALRSLCRRAGGGIYVGGDGAVYAYDGDAWSRVPAPGASHSLAEDENGVLWRVDQTGRFLVWRANSDAGDVDAGDAGARDTSAGDGEWQVVSLPADVGPGVAVKRSDSGTFWVAGRRGVLGREGGTWRDIAAGASPPAAITAFLPARDGTVWIGTEEGKLYYGRHPSSGWTEATLSGWRGGWIRALEEDLRGRIWAGGNVGDVAFGRIDEDFTIWTEENGLHPAGRMVIYADREGNLWFSSNGRGLQQWIGEAWSHRNLWQTEGILERRALVFGLSATHDGGFLAAVFNRGVWRWNGREMLQYGKEQGLVQDVRLALEPEPEVVWVAARFGVFASRNGGTFRQTLRLPAGFVYDFKRSPEGIWHANTSAQGIYRQVSSGWEPAAELNRELPDLNVRALLWRDNGELWAATMGGVVVFGKEDDPDAGRRAEHLGGEEEFSLGAHALLEVDDEIWIGGFRGILVLGQDENGERTSRRYTEADGLPGHTVYALARGADGSVWAGGSAGVGHIRKDALGAKRGGFLRYGMADGLLEAECNLNGLLLAPDGSMLVGTMASLARFDTRVKALPRPPLKVYWRERPEPEEMGIARLDAHTRSLRLSFVAPWLGPQRIEYRTRIPRLRSEWSSPQSENFLSLENLGPGLWEVEAAARFADEEEWTPPVVTRFRIAPRFFETWYFYGFLAALLALGVAAVVRLRTRRLAAHAHKLERAVKEHLAQIKILGGLLPICTGCKKVRDDTGYWHQIESYIRRHSEAEFSHGLCPDCLARYYPDLAE